jgi:SAM-dependent methyltransferase
MEKEPLVCPVCRAMCQLIDVVDLNKSCIEAQGKRLVLAEYPVYYALCGECGFCFAPEMHGWSLEEFEEWIYNDEYSLVDPDFLGSRARENAALLPSMFPNLPANIKHLDYGGGDGLLASLLREANWLSTSYDPFIDRSTHPAQLGNFELITAFEVFEHVPDVQQLMADLRALITPGGLILFSTLLSDGNIDPLQRLSWWYAAPRNGHISLYSKQSLTQLARQSGFQFGSFSPYFHFFCESVPPWAAHVIPDH